jgi:hypothetical protein
MATIKNDPRKITSYQVYLYAYACAANGQEISLTADQLPRTLMACAIGIRDAKRNAEPRTPTQFTSAMAVRDFPETK